jgi:phage/plasmid-like protein (TIGR03299 family)
MAHELTIRSNGKAEMAFTGETPWHGLGQPVTVGASIGVWQREAGMDWEALEGTPSVLVNPKNDDYLNFDDYTGLYRSDTRAPLAIVGANYKVVQPKEVLEFFRDLTEGGGWHIHTAGTLRGGRKLWAMASNGEGGRVDGRSRRDHGIDEVRSNLLLATSLDGSMKTTAMLTAVRVVCANTLALALRDGEDEGTAIKVSHRSYFNPAEIKESLGVARESFEYFMQQARDMADTPIKLDEALDVLRNIFGQPIPSKAKAKEDGGVAWMGKLSELNLLNPVEAEEEEQERRTVLRCLELFDGAAMGADLKTAKGTRWGLFNAVTQHVDHEMGRSRDTGLDNAWFGRGNAFKQDALKLLVPA